MTRKKNPRLVKAAHYLLPLENEMAHLYIAMDPEKDNLPEILAVLQDLRAIYVCDEIVLEKALKG